MSAPGAAVGRREPVLAIGDVIALPVRRRAVAVGAALTVAVIIAVIATLSLGRLGIGVTELPGAIAAVLAGSGSGKEEFVLANLRGPRLVVAVGVGAALGISGALFQSVTRNPLGSPDVIGVSAGASAGAAIASLSAEGWVAPALAAVAGAAGAVGLVALATGSGLGNPMRMVLAGIGVSAFAYAIVYYVMYVIARDHGMQLAAYLSGTLEARNWAQALTIWVALAVCAVPLALICGPLGLTEMSDELAAGLGVDVTGTRRWAVLLSVVLAGAAVAVAGPVAFIALTAPHIARRLARSTTPALLLSAVTGALLLVAADLAIAQLPLFEGLPVGVLTLGIGGAYLGVLLISEWRKT